MHNTEHLKPGTRESQCGACGRYFLSPTGFDRHRYTDKDGIRRCRTTREMREQGMVKDGKGRWGLGAKERGAGQVQDQQV